MTRYKLLKTLGLEGKLAGVIKFRLLQFFLGCDVLRDLLLKNAMSRLSPKNLTFSLGVKNSYTSKIL